MDSLQQNVLIINSVPINGGDEALLKATLLGINHHFEKHTIDVLCNNPELYKKHIDYVNLDWDWEYAFFKKDDDESNFVFKIKSKLRRFINTYFKVSFYSTLSQLFASNREKRVFKTFEKADIIIVSAGGYFHDFYKTKKRIESILFIKDVLNKDYYFFAQSIGPFWKNRDYSKLLQALTGAKKIILREKLSEKHLESIGYHNQNTVVTNDVAFYLNSSYALPVNNKRSLKKIVVNFREWRNSSDQELDINKAVLFCTFLLEKGYEITFLSTCQGVDGYVDDSKIADIIIEKIPNSLINKCKVLSKKFDLEDFIRVLSTHDAYIGMRLHGAILSLLAGIPAINIAYEDKTFGIFRSLEIDDYCFSSDSGIEEWKEHLAYFELNYKSYLNKIETIRNNASNSGKTSFSYLVKSRIS